MIIYRRLWSLLEKRGVSQYYLIKHYCISPSQITRLKRNQGVSTHTLNTFCSILDCRLDEIAEYIPDDTPASISEDAPTHTSEHNKTKKGGHK